MKKILSILILIIITINISACNMLDNTTDKLKIVTTIFPYYSFAKEICGDDAEITMLLKPGMESHTYDPSAQDILAIKNADIFIYTGGESDKWVETILSTMDTDKTKVIKAIDTIKLTYDQPDNIYDEHIWTSVKNAKSITDKIYVEIDNPKYQDNKDILDEKLHKLDMEFNKLAINSADKTLIFADRFPFSHFINDYGFKYISAFPSCSEETEPSVQDMASIINTINEQNIPAVFYIEFSNQKIADTIQSETGADKLLLHSCHNVTMDEFSSGVSYLSLMEQNLENLKEALE